MDTLSHGQMIIGFIVYAVLNGIASIVLCIIVSGIDERFKKESEDFVRKYEIGRIERATDENSVRQDRSNKVFSELIKHLGLEYRKEELSGFIKKD